MVVNKVIPVGVRNVVAGIELLAVGELWFLLDTDWRWRWVLFDGIGVIRKCLLCNGVIGIVGDRIHGCSVDELGAFKSAVKKFLEDVSIGS